MYGEGSMLTQMADRFLTSQGQIVGPSLSSLPRHPLARRVKRICRPDGSVTYVHESCGFRSEMTFAGGHMAEGS
jgi:hypothetical protein